MRSVPLRFALVLLVFAALSWAWWSRQGSLAREQADKLGSEAAALRRCVGASGAEALRARLLLSPPGASPLAACMPAAERLEQRRAALASSMRRRSGDLAPSLLAASRAVREFPLDAPAIDLVRRVDDLASALSALISGGCEAAASEGAPACAQGPAGDAAPALPAPRVILDEPASTPRVAWVATSAERSLSVRVAAGEAFELWSPDGEVFTATRLPGPPPPAEEPPQLVEDGGRRYALRVGYGDSIYIGRSSSLQGGAAVDEGALPPLPPGHRPAGGVRAVRLGGAWSSVGRDEQGRGALVDAQGKVRQAPEGELVGAFHEGGPRLLLKRQGKTGFVDLAMVAAPPPGEPWGAEVVATVSHVPALTFVDGPERGCGLEGERYATVVGAQGEEGALIALSRRKVHAFRFHTEAGSRYAPLCGSCPPMALEARAADLGLFVPVRRALTPARIAAPMAYERGRSAASASGSCTASRAAVVYEAKGRLLVQQREGEGWSFGEPRVVAERSEHGAPVEPSLLGIGERLVLVFRRDTPGRMRIEAISL